MGIHLLHFARATTSSIAFPELDAYKMSLLLLVGLHLYESSMIFLVDMHAQRYLIE